MTLISFQHDQPLQRDRFLKGNVIEPRLESFHH
jgi:hypothetical protein